jgi:NADH:ubiquinone oxidoreductase subunit 6 (subunit J)
MTWTFLILGALTVAGAVAAVTLHKLVHCALALAICFVGLAGLYLDLGAQFVGLAQVLVYVGAVVILIVFAILLTRSDETPLSKIPQVVGGIVVSAAVFALLAWAVMAGGELQGAAGVTPEAPMREIGGALMTRFVLPLEVVGLLLTAVLIGAVVIAMEEKQGTR